MMKQIIRGFLRMRIDSNYHTHLALCKHAEGTAEDYIEKAIKLNYQEIGISDHGPLSDDLEKMFVTRRMNKTQYYQIYLKELAVMKKRYEKSIRVLSGLEVEYFEEMINDYPVMLKEVDYLILGQHFIKLPNGKYMGLYSNMTPERIFIYAKEVVQALSTKYFRILAHPELYLYNYQTWDQNAIKVAEMIIDAAIKYDVLLEVNANGIRKKQPFLNKDNELVYVYPRLEFWQLVKEKGAKVIINDDCHYLSHLGDEATEKAFNFAHQLGLNVVTRLF